MAQKSQKISFSEKNIDIFNLLENMKKNKAINISDYVCESIREFEKNKKNNGPLDFDTVEKLVDEKLKEFKEQLIKEGISINDINENDLLEKITEPIDVGDD